MKSWTPQPEMYDFGRPFPEPIIKELFEDLGAKIQGGDFKVFEPGCGTGRILIPLARANPQWSFVGMDSSPGCLEVCQRRLLEGRIENCSAKLGLIPTQMPRGPFDLIIHSSVLHVVPNWRDALAVLADRLSHSGVFCLIGDYGDIYDAALGRFNTPGIDPALAYFWERYIELRRLFNAPNPESSQIGCRWDLESTDLAIWLSSNGFCESYRKQISWQEHFSIERLMQIVEQRCYSSMFTVEQDTYSKIVTQLKEDVRDIKERVTVSRHQAVVRFFAQPVGGLPKATCTA
jgi:SAM-dependent methyltransferase